MPCAIIGVIVKTGAQKQVHQSLAALGVLCALSTRKVRFNLAHAQNEILLIVHVLHVCVHG